MSPPITPHFHCRMGMFAKTRPFFPKNFLSYSNFYFFQNLKFFWSMDKKNAKLGQWARTIWRSLLLLTPLESASDRYITLIGSLDVFGRKGSELSTKKITLKLLTQKLYRLNVYVPKTSWKSKKKILSTLETIQKLRNPFLDSLDLPPPKKNYILLEQVFYSYPWKQTSILCYHLYIVINYLLAFSQELIFLFEF